MTSDGIHQRFLSPEVGLEQTTARKSRRKKGSLPAWASFLILTGVLAAFAGLIYYAYQPKNGVQLEPLEADLRENLRIGESTRADANAWFSAHGVSEVHEIADTGGNKNGYLVQIPNDSWMKQTQIEIMVRFDRGGKLKEITMYEAKRD
jgi:hypothetical protein